MVMLFDVLFYLYVLFYVKRFSVIRLHVFVCFALGVWFVWLAVSVDCSLVYIAMGLMCFYICLMFNG